MALLLASFVTLLGPLVQQGFSGSGAAAPAVSQARKGMGADAPVALPKFFAMQGGRIVVAGPAKSGKTTVLYSLLQRALADPSFATRILLDGKGDALSRYAHLSGVTYYGPDDYQDWLKTLQMAARELPGRYQKLINAGKRRVEPGAARLLVVIDGLERAIADPRVGREIAETLLLVADRPDALADVLMMTVQSSKPQPTAQEVLVRTDVLIVMPSGDKSGAFSIQTNLSGPVEGSGQARLVYPSDAAGLS